MIRRFNLALAVIIALHSAPVWGLDLIFPNQAVLILETRAPMATRRLAIGPFHDDAFVTMTAPVQDSAFRLPADADMSTASLVAPLRAQLIAAGYRLIYECETRACGGFDFRYGLELLPEPEMHVDLGDFRYLLGQKGDDRVSLMVSRSANYGFVQVTRMGDGAKPVPRVTESSKSPLSALGAALTGGTVAVIGGAVFASGQAQMENTQIPALEDLADWLAANPNKRVTITGHTDTSGQAADNVALSLARAMALRTVLISQYRIAADRISAIGAGDTAPIVPNDTAAGRAQNRRLEVAVTP